MYSHEFVTVGFDADKFDHNVPHTIEEWRSFFFAVNPDAHAVDQMSFDSPNTRTNIHRAAFNVYLDKKRKKGLIKEQQ